MATTDVPAMAADRPLPPTPEGEAAEFAEQPTTQPAGQPTVQELIGMMKDMMNTYEQRLASLQAELAKQNKKESDFDDEKLRPINIKDLKMPSDYDNDPKELMEWHARFMTLLQNRNKHWMKLMKVIEEFGDKRIKKNMDIENKLKEKQIGEHRGQA